VKGVLELVHDARGGDASWRAASARCEWGEVSGVLFVVASLHDRVSGLDNEVEALSLLGVFVGDDVGCWGYDVG
jgi:hypothetical protein